MKTKYLLSLALLLLGTNLFTYATTRYMTTERVLTAAQERVDIALKEEGLFDTVYSPEPGHPKGYHVRFAIKTAGGMYFWGPDRALYYYAGLLLVCTGVLLPFVGPKRHAPA